MSSGNPNNPSDLPPQVVSRGKKAARRILLGAGLTLVAGGVGAAVHNNAAVEVNAEAATTAPPPPVAEAASAVTVPRAEAAQPSTAPTTELGHDTTVKPAVAKPKSETRTTQPAVEHEPSAFEKAEALGRASTVQLRFQAKNRTETYDSTTSGASAVHLGNGLFMSVRHPIRGQEFGPDGPKNGIYDIISYDPEVNSLWSGNGPGDMTMKAEAKGLVVNGDSSQADLSLFYAPDAASMPSLKLANTAPNIKEDYFFTGYPHSTNKQMQFQAEYLGEAKVGDFNQYHTYAMNDEDRIYLFGIPKGTPNAEEACANGESGGTVSNENGEAFGPLAVSGKPGDVVYQAALNLNPDTKNMEAICGMQVVTHDMFESYKTQIGHPSPQA